MTEARGPGTGAPGHGTPARRIEVSLAPAYPVHVGARALDAARAEFARERPRVLLSDARVFALHGAKLDPTGDARVCLVPEGERAKELGELGRVLDFLASAGVDRNGTLWTLGGGAVGDLGGLAAALYMRGIAVVHCPTTLLAQVDASVGGKTAINLAAGKNLAGTFHQPRAVHADASVLATQDEAEYRSGLGEVLKTALVDGEELLGELERSAPRLVARDRDAIESVVAACVRAKARIVVEDPGERGPRRALNLGHTFAHALERTAGYGSIPHGVAVAAGIGLALRASRELGLLEDRALPTRVARLAEALGLPTGLGSLRAAAGVALPPRELVDAMRLDKKSRSGALRLVLPRAAGRLELDVPADGALVESWLAG